MFKLISGLVASAVVLAPMLPARADFGIGVQIGSPGYRVQRGFYRSQFPYGGSGVIIRNTIDRPYYNYGAPGYYPPGYYTPNFPSSTVIVAPRVRTVIVNPGYNSYPACGSAIYGSPIASPIPVNPYTGLACR